MRLDGRLTPNSSMDPKDWPIAGDLSIQLSELAWLSALVSDVELTKASLDGQVALGGVLGAPTIDGHYRAQAESIALPAAGIDLRDTNLTLRGNQQKLRVSGSTRSGDEPLALEAFAVVA